MPAWKMDLWMGTAGGRRTCCHSTGDKAQARCGLQDSGGRTSCAGRGGGGVAIYSVFFLPEKLTDGGDIQGDGEHRFRGRGNDM